MPIFWFSLVNIDAISSSIAIHIFIILHLFVYPASNGYNSYFDKDKGSIGGLKNPPKVDKKLFNLVALWDFLAILYSLFISLDFAILMLIYTLVSKAYSYDKIRLKKYPIVSTLIVTFFQGSFIYFSIQWALTQSIEFILDPFNLIMGMTATLFLVGSYPITQIYQHEEDKERGDITISIRLGKIGTLIFSSILFGFATLLLAYCFYSQNKLENLFIYLACGAPILLYFGLWSKKVLKDSQEANFENTMKMNTISSLSLSLAFIIMLFLK
jgi:1,4-dihydroxy-2-naphthoate octaprenyltransferase